MMIKLAKPLLFDEWLFERDDFSHVLHDVFIIARKCIIYAIPASNWIIENAIAGF
jgi:hypothetical protein